MEPIKETNALGRLEFDPSSGLATLFMEMEGSANKINQAFGLGQQGFVLR